MDKQDGWLKIIAALIGGVALVVAALINNRPPPVPVANATQAVVAEVGLPTEPPVIITEPPIIITETPAATEPAVAPPETFFVTNDYEISVCCNSVGQRSDVIDYAISVYTVNVLGMEFRSTDPNACSDIVLHILLDGEEIYTTDAVGPLSGNDTTYWLDLSFAAYEGEHTLTLSPEGIFGGCNTGTLGGWGGTLTVQTDQY